MSSAALPASGCSPSSQNRSVIQSATASLQKSISTLVLRICAVCIPIRVGTPTGSGRAETLLCRLLTFNSQPPSPFTLLKSPFNPQFPPFPVKHFTPSPTSYYPISCLARQPPHPPPRRIPPRFRSIPIVVILSAATGQSLRPSWKGSVLVGKDLLFSVCSPPATQHSPLLP